MPQTVTTFEDTSLPKRVPSLGITVAYHSSPQVVASAGNVNPEYVVTSPFLNHLIVVFTSLSPSGSKKINETVISSAKPGTAGINATSKACGARFSAM